MGESGSVPRKTRGVPKAATWWTKPWPEGSPEDPDVEWSEVAFTEAAWHVTDRAVEVTDEAILRPLEAQFGQVRSRERVRELAEVFTHQREIDAMLALVPDAFAELDIKFLEPTCGSGNFLVEILRRKLRLVSKLECRTQEQYEHRLLRAAASVYGVDISPENVTEARARMAHVLLEHYQLDANTIEPTVAFLNAAALIIGDNVVTGDTLNHADAIELCDWRPTSKARFQRIWSFALVPEDERGLFWVERVEDAEPVHFSELARTSEAPKRRRGKAVGK